MSNSESGWLKKFLGEDASIKALKERLEETTALVETKDQTIAQLERQVAELTTLAGRETLRADGLEARVEDLKGVVSETELSRSVTEELLNHAEARATQAATDLANERKNLVNVNLAKSKAEANVKLMATQVQKLEKQTLDLRTQLTRAEGECATLRSSVANLEGQVTQQVEQHQLLTSDLEQSRAFAQRLSAAKTDLEGTVAELKSRVEAHSSESRRARDELETCQKAYASLLQLAADAAQQGLGRGLPIAVRLAAEEARSPFLAAGDVEFGPSVKSLEGALSSMGLAGHFRLESEEEMLLEFPAAPLGHSLATVGHLLGGWAALNLSTATQRPFRVHAVTTSARVVTISLLGPVE